jgi:tRNA nucleotidyltransferase (CCA-adding enzyme)
MQVYLVGGAVRDRLLGLPVRERDWVVVGGSPEALASQGYRAVGRDFPVFLHPSTHEEYALARTERKTAPGYHGFVFNYSAGVTLEEDLGRRDLTINAMAEDGKGRLVDPYHGQQDLDGRWLRHVSPAFAEDPVRILRVARFAARFAPLGFKVAADTRALMRAMVAAGEVAALVPERVWAETQKALAERDPARYFEELHECGALAVLFPEIDGDWQGPAAPPPAIAALRSAARLSTEPRVRLAALTAGLAATGDFRVRQAAIETLGDRLKLPNEFRALALLTLRGRARADAALRLPAAEIVTLLEELDAFRRPERFAEFLLVAEALYTARARRAYPQREYLSAAFIAARAVKLGEPVLAGKQAGDALRALRIAAVAALPHPP